MIKWNRNLKLVFSDVDETIADLYTAATHEMCRLIEKIIEEGTVIFFVTGQSIKSIQWRIIDQIKPELRKNLLVGHCNGAEVWGFDVNGNLKVKPFYSFYENALTQVQKKEWRGVVAQIIREFKLQVYSAEPISDFKVKAGDNPLAIMLEDRGPQITLEVINGYDLTVEQEKELEWKVSNAHGSLDLRVPIIERVDKLLQEKSLPITPRLGGVFAIDLSIKGVSKTTAIKTILDNEEILSSMGLHRTDLVSEHMEVWGDKFSVIRGGTDRHISEALPKAARSIDFRKENPQEFLEGYNIVLWDGEKHLHEGLLEFLDRSFNPNILSRVKLKS